MSLSHLVTKTLLPHRITHFIVKQSFRR